MKPTIRDVEAAVQLRNLADFSFRKKLPQEFGGGTLYVTPRADYRVLIPGWQKAAPDLLEVARKYVSVGDVVWDVGANLGVFTAFAAGASGIRGHVYAVEAIPRYVELLTRSAAGFPNSSSKVTVLCSGVADREGYSQFRISHRGHARSALSAISTESSGEHITVPTTTLDALARIWRLPHFLKIDVNGAEILAMKGADHILSTARPKMYIEVLDANADEASRMLTFYRYSLYQITRSRRDPRIERPGIDTVAIPAEQEL